MRSFRSKAGFKGQISNAFNSNTLSAIGKDSFKKIEWRSKKKRVRRLFVTLIELLIAMGLMSILLSALMGVYMELTSLQGELNKTRRVAFDMRYLQHTLQRVFSRGLPVDGKQNKNNFFFLSNRDDPLGLSRLIFTFDNGVDLRPLFSATTVGMCFLDKNGESGRGELKFRKWPLPSCVSDQVPPVQDEVLLRGVESIRFLFFVPKPPEGAEREGSASQSNETDLPRDEWVDSWPMEYRRLPAIVKLQMTLDEVATREYKKNNLEFAFFLGASNYPVIIP